VLGMNSAASDIIAIANTAAALEFSDSTTKFVVMDTRNTVTGISNVLFNGIPSTITAASGVVKYTVNIVPGTTTLTGSTGVTAMNGLGLYVAQPTVTDEDSVTVTTASTVYIADAPAGAGSGPAALTNAYALNVAAGGVNFGGAFTTSSTIVQTVAALGANVRGSSFSYTCAAPAMGDGYGAHEVQLTISGTATGHAAADTSWINIGSGATIPNALNIYTPHNDGIWEDVGCTMSGGILAFGARMHADLGDSSGWDMLCPWSINTNRAITALIHAANPILDVAYQAATPIGGACGSVPFMVANNGTVLYMRLYADATT